MITYNNDDHNTAAYVDEVDEHDDEIHEHDDDDNDNEVDEHDDIVMMRMNMLTSVHM